jgi:hypothetical protein
MSVTALSVLKHVAVDMLSDPSSKRWSINQLVRYTNRVQQTIGILRPDLFIEKRAHALSAGVRQTLPSGYVRAIEFLCNTSGRSLTAPSDGRAMMDLQSPEWREDAQSATIYHVFYDVREPLAYEVWPPASSSASLDVKLQKTITAIAEPGTPNKTYADVTGNLSLIDDSMWMAVADGVAFLAYFLDSQYANQPRAMAYAQSMASLLGVELSKAIELGPKGAVA